MAIFITADLGGSNTRVAHASNLEQPAFTDTHIRRNEVVNNFEKPEDDEGAVITVADGMNSEEILKAVS